MDDEQIGERIKGAAAEVEHSTRVVPGLLDRAVRRHRRGIAVRGGALALAVVAAVVAVPLLSGPEGRPSGGLLSGGDPADEPSATPAPAVTTPSLPPSPVAPTAKPAPQPPAPSEEPEPTAPATTAPPAAVTHCATPTGEEPKPSGVTVRIESARTDGKLRLTIRVRNDGLTPVQYTTSGREYDFWADDADGTVWVWSLGQAFIEPLIYRTLQPGEEVSRTVDWDLTGCAGGEAAPARLPAGSYTVRGLWVSDAERGASWWSDGVSVTITE